MKWIAALVLLTGAATAEMRPVARPLSETVVLSTRGSTETPAVAAISDSVRPVVRRTVDERQALTIAAIRRAVAPRIDVDGGVVRSTRPAIRPADLVLAASRTPRRNGAGGLCGRGSLSGTVIPPVTGRGGCGIADAVRITAVGGLSLSRPSRMNCRAARALDDWVRDGVVPTIGRTGGGAVALQVAAGYACRTRNNRPGGKLSEHAKGSAIDISAIALADGQRITVLTDWNRGIKGQMLRTLWRRACGPFGTVLGPDSDRYHRDHFHFDVAAYRSGSYCR